MKGKTSGLDICPTSFREEQKRTFLCAVKKNSFQVTSSLHVLINLAEKNESSESASRQVHLNVLEPFTNYNNLSAKEAGDPNSQGWKKKELNASLEP